VVAPAATGVVADRVTTTLAVPTVGLSSRQISTGTMPLAERPTSVKAVPP
jgi:hypothetical protein